MKYLRDFWNFIIAVWKLDRGFNYYSERFKFIAGIIPKFRISEENLFDKDFTHSFNFNESFCSSNSLEYDLTPLHKEMALAGLDTSKTYHVVPCNQVDENVMFNIYEDEERTILVYSCTLKIFKKWEEETPEELGKRLDRDLELFNKNLAMKITEIPRNSEKVLLHEAETCYECGKIFLSLYPLKKCEDHEGMDRI